MYTTGRMFLLMSIIFIGISVHYADEDFYGEVVQDVSYSVKDVSITAAKNIALTTNGYLYPYELYEEGQ
jgi:hypothetical protein